MVSSLVFGSVCYAKNYVINLDTTITDKTIVIIPFLSFKTSDKIKEAIDNGTRIQLIAKAQLFEPNNWWFNKEIDNKKFNLEVSYFTLSKLYVVKNMQSGKQQGFNDYEQLWKELGKLSVFKFKNPSKESLMVRFRLMLDKGALPTVMQLPVLIDSQWDINTPWFNKKISPK